MGRGREMGRWKESGESTDGRSEGTAGMKGG